MEKQNINDDGAVMLVEAIIKEAVDDYVRNAVKIHKLEDSMCDATYIKREKIKLDIGRAEGEMVKIEKFFRSQWYQQMCCIDGEKMIKQMKRMAEEKIQELRSKEVGGKRRSE